MAHEQEQPKTVEEFILLIVKQYGGSIESYTRLSHLSQIKYPDVVKAVKNLVSQGLVEVLVGKNNACVISLIQNVEPVIEQLTFNTSDLAERVLIALKHNNGVIDSYSELGRIIQGKNKYYVRRAVDELIQQGKVQTQKHNDINGVSCTRIILCDNGGQATIDSIPVKTESVDNNVDDLVDNIRSILDQNKRLQSQYDALKQDYDALESKYNAVTSQLDTFARLKKDIMLVASKIKVAN
jgi:archaellum component FlaC